MSKSSNWESTIKPIVVLSVISLIASLLLALVNGMTAPVIAENTKRTTLAAYVGVLPSVSDASELEEVTDYTTAGITGVVKTPDAVSYTHLWATGTPMLPRGNTTSAARPTICSTRRPVPCWKSC